MLVSIVVITYNSSRFVLETLESAYRQTYQDIELIVSDDCSTDDTIHICQQWIEAHKGHFVHALCTQTPHNGGICWNYNHALKFAQGEWIKYIAGDDILKDNCIERYVANIKHNIFIYSCASEHLNQQTKARGIYCTRLPNERARAQVRLMLIKNYLIEGSTLFFEKTHLIILGGFDTQFNMLEDWPIVIKYLTKGYNIVTIYETLVQWRTYNNSVSQPESQSYTLFYDSVYRSMKYYTLHYCWRYGLFLHQYYYWLKYWIDKHQNDGACYKGIGYFLRCFDVIRLYRKIRPSPCRLFYVYPNHDNLANEENLH